MGVSPHWVAMYPYVEKHLEECRGNSFSEVTITDRREVLCRVIHDLGDLHTLTAMQIGGWLGRRGWAPQTRSTYDSHIRGYLGWARRHGLIPANPMDLLDRPRVPHRDPRRTSRAAAERILDEAVEPWLTAGLLARWAGLRCHEIAKCRREDVAGPEVGEPVGWLTVAGKGGRVDELPLHPVLWEHIRRRPLGPVLYDAAGRPYHPLVRDTHGRPYHPHTLSKMWAAYVREKLHIPGVSLHRLRALYANTLREVRKPDGTTIDIEVIRTLMRHRSLATTQRYLCARDEERRDAIRALPAA